MLLTDTDEKIWVKKSYNTINLYRVLILTSKLRRRGSLFNISKHHVIKDYCRHYLYVSLQRIQLLNSDTRWLITLN